MKSKRERDEWLARWNARVAEKRDRRMAEIREKGERRKAAIEQRLSDDARPADPEPASDAEVDEAVRRVEYWSSPSGMQVPVALFNSVTRAGVPSFPSKRDHQLAARRRMRSE